jgi:hypothetical protein
MMEQSPSKQLYKSPLFLTLFGVLVVVVLAYFLVGKAHVFGSSESKSETVTAGQSTKGESSTDDSTSNNASSNEGSTTDSQPGDTKGNSSSGTNLVAPSGTFVSAHKNVPVSAALSSVCNTTVGAQCTIVFTSDAVKKSLVAQATDRGGATYWSSWTPASVGLTPGTWHVQAIASLDGQTKTSDDAVALVVTE